MTKVEAEYDRLRSIGCSVETADALASVVASLPSNRREAFYLWASGMSYRQIERALHMSHRTINKMVDMVKLAYSVEAFGGE